MKIYGLVRSRSSRVLWAAAEAGVAFEYTALDFRAGEQLAPAFLALNAAAKVPVIEDADVVLTESAAIVNYIAAKYAPQFMPDDLVGKAQYDRWSYFCLSELEQPLWTIAKHKFALPAEQRVPEIFATAGWEFQKALALLSEGLADSSYILGEQFSMADVLIGQTLAWGVAFKQTIPQDNVQAYLARCVERPAYKKMLAEEGRA